MKHLFALVCIPVASGVLAVSQFYITGLYGRLVFWPIMILLFILYYRRNR